MEAASLLATQTLTFLFTDIEGSTSLLQRLRNAYAEVLADHHGLIRTVLAAHAGKEVDTQGDAFFAVFSSPSACVAAAIEMHGRSSRTCGLPAKESSSAWVFILAKSRRRLSASSVSKFTALLVLRQSRTEVRSFCRTRLPPWSATRCRRRLPQGPRYPPAEGPRPARADLPGRGRRPSVGVPAAKVSRRPEAAEQPSSAGIDLHRPRG